MKAEQLATIGMCLSYADGDVDPSEIAYLMLAMGDMGISEADAEAAIDAAGAKIESGAKVDELLAVALKAVAAKQRPAIFELCAHVLMGDGRFTEAEAQRLAAVRMLLGLDEAVAYKIVAAASVEAVAREDGFTIE